MVTLTRKTNTVEITFDGSPTYLYNGVISAPLGSLVLITDQSDMATVRRAPSFDILFSAKIADMEFDGTQATSANINDLFNATCGNSGGGGGGDLSNYYTKQETDAALSGKQDTLSAGSGVSISGNVISVTAASPDMSNYYTKTEIDQTSRVVSEALHELHDEKADTSAVTASISAATSGKANSADVYTKTEMDTALSGKQNTLTAGSGVSISGDTISVTGGGTNVVTLTQAQYDALATKDPGTIYVISDAPSAYYTKQEVDSAISAATSGKADTTAMTAAISAATSGKANSADVYAKTDVDNAPTSGSTNLLTSGTLYNVLGDIDTALTNIIGGN